MIQRRLTLTALALIASGLLASGYGERGGSHEEGVVFPAWTYYVEVVEHTVMAVIAFYVLVRLLYHNKPKKAVKIGFAGFALLLISQVLTIMHHYLLYTFGVYTAVVHHGLLLVSITLIGYALITSVSYSA